MLFLREGPDLKNVGSTPGFFCPIRRCADHLIESIFEPDCGTDKSSLPDGDGGCAGTGTCEASWRSRDCDGGHVWRALTY